MSSKIAERKSCEKKLLWCSSSLDKLKSGGVKKIPRIRSFKYGKYEAC